MHANLFLNDEEINVIKRLILMMAIRKNGYMVITLLSMKKGLLKFLVEVIQR